MNRQQSSTAHPETNPSNSIGQPTSNPITRLGEINFHKSSSPSQPSVSPRPHHIVVIEEGIKAHPLPELQKAAAEATGEIPLKIVTIAPGEKELEKAA